jgi:iron(III) transport system permease protein
MKSASTLSAEAGIGALPARPGQSAASLLRSALALLLAAIALLPAAYLLAAALPVLSDGGWLAHFTSTSLPHQAATSLKVALQAGVIALAVGAVPALAVARCDFRGRGLVTALALLPLLFAPSVTAGTWTVAYSWSFLESRHALGLLHGLACAPYVFIVFRVAAARIPTSYAELAAALGLGPWQRLWRVHLPSHAVPLAASVLIVSAQTIGDYAAAERLGIDTLSVGVHNLWLASQSAQVAAIVATVMTVPAVLLVLVATWAATAFMNQAPIAPAAAAARRRPLGRGATTLLLGWSLGWSVAGFWWPEWLTLRWAWLKLARTRFADIPFDMLNAAATALCTALLVALVCVATVALLRTGGRSRWAERLPWLFLSNYFLPPLVLGLAFVMMSRDGSLGALWLGSWRDSRLLVVLSEALRYLPFAMLPVLDALRRTPEAGIELARAFGAGPLRARLVAFAGHLGPALLLGCALVFMEAVKELDMSLTLQPFGYSAPALKIYAFSRHQNMDRAAVWVLISQALMLLPLALLAWRLHRLGGRAAR